MAPGAQNIQRGQSRISDEEPELKALRVAFRPAMEKKIPTPAIRARFRIPTSLRPKGHAFHLGFRYKTHQFDRVQLNDRGTKRAGLQQAAQLGGVAF